MTGLFIDISDYVTDSIEEEHRMQRIEEEYTIISSIANTKEFRKRIAWKREHGPDGKFIKKNILR